MIVRLFRRLLRPFRERKDLARWAATIDASPRGRKRIAEDYLNLFRTKGLTREEYVEFEFDKRDEAFRESFLGLNEQRFYLDYLNPIKYYSLARNKYLAHKILENTGVRKS